MKMSCPWAKCEERIPVNLTEIMSEEISKNLQIKKSKIFENKSLQKALTSQLESSENVGEISALSPTGTEITSEVANDKIFENDVVMAKMPHLQLVEEEYNTAADFEYDDDDEETEVLNEHYHPEHEFALPSDQCIKYEMFNLKLSNKVSNHKESRKNKSDYKKDQAVAEVCTGQFFHKVLHKMINSRILKKVDSIINVSKEAVTYHAYLNSSFQSRLDKPNDCVVKVYKSALPDFKQWDKYTVKDPHQKFRIAQHSTKKTIHQSEAEKEMTALIKMTEAGVLCPEVITMKMGILVMSFIGKNHKMAPTLKNVTLATKEYIEAYVQTQRAIHWLYDRAHLILGNISEDNILWYEGNCYFINVNQSVDVNHERAFDLLYNDCRNITNFFDKKNFGFTLYHDYFFETVTGCNYHDKVSLQKLRESFNEA